MDNQNPKEHYIYAGHLVYGPIYNRQLAEKAAAEILDNHSPKVSEVTLTEVTKLKYTDQYLEEHKEAVKQEAARYTL